MGKCDNSVIENNLIERCNWRYISADRNYQIEWNECAGVKALCSKGLTIKNNIIRSNYGKASGAWLDNYCSNNFIDGNIILNNNFGIYLEYDCGIKDSVNKITNNIILFNRIDGVNSTDSTNPALIAHNILAYNGRWGVAVITSMRGGKDNSPYSFKVCNNIFFKNERGVCRMPLLDPLQYPQNIFLGNVFKAKARFQLDMGARQNLSSENMIKEMTGYLVKAGINKCYWPDFANWSASNKWFRGCCRYKAFASSMPGKGNIELTGKMNVHLYEQLIRFNYDEPEAHPVGERIMRNLIPDYILVIDGLHDSKVNSIPELQTDMLLDKRNGAKVTAGPLESIANNILIKISLIKKQNGLLPH